MCTQPYRLIHLDMTTPQTSVPNTRTSVWEGSRRGARRVGMSVRARSARTLGLRTHQTPCAALDSSRARRSTREPQYPRLTARPCTITNGKQNRLSVFPLTTLTL